MQLTVETAWVLSLVLASVRVASILAFTPVLGLSSVPGNVRAMFVIALSALIVSALPTPALPVTGSLVEFALLGMNEVILGASMGFGVMAVFAAFAIGGKILDYQMGIGIATLFDPATKSQTSLNGTLLSMLGALIFIVTDAHHTLIRGVAYSFSVMPPGHGAVPDLGLVLAQAVLMFSFGFALVAPAAVGLMMIDLGVGVVSRVMPQVNAYFISLPVKVFVGLFLLALSLSFMGPFMTGMFEAIFHGWQKLLGSV